MAIGESELNRIGEYVQSHLQGWMERLGVRAPQDAVTNTQLLERVVRVEEELKAQRDIMITKFEASDARIGDLMKTIDDRFQTMDKRFEDLTGSFNKRFSLLTWMIGVITAMIAATLGVLLV